MATKRFAPAIVIVLAICLAYANSLHNGFHFDDFHTVIDNPAVRSLKNVPHFFTDATTFSVLPANRTYRPMVSTSLAVDYALGRGYSEFWFHATTLILFLVLVLLMADLYRSIMDRVGPSPANVWLAWFAAAWFGLHPAMAETVNYIIQRGDLYCTLGCVGALVIYTRYRGLKRWGIYLLPLVFALLSKPPSAVFPVLLFFYVFFFGSPEAKGSRFRASVSAAVPSAIVVTLLLWLQSTMTPKTFLPAILSPWEYRLTQPFVWLRYFREFLLPVHLNVDTDLQPLHALDARMFAGFLFAGLICTIIVYTARRRLYPIAYGLIWFIVTQLPTSLYPLSEVENDHRMFFSFVGLILAVVWAIWLLVKNLPGALKQRLVGPLGIGMAALVLAAYGFGVHMRNQVWLNEETLWCDDVQKSPHNGRGLMIYGLTQMNKGAYAAALDEFIRAQVYTPNYPALEINLGIVEGAIADGPPPNAVTQAVSESHFQRAIALASADDTTHAFYGRWLKAHNRLAEAEQQLQTAVDLNPQRPLQRDELISTYAADGDVTNALLAARQALAVVPDDPLALQTLAHPPVRTTVFWINLSLAQYRTGHYQESIASAREALVVNPNSAEAYNNIGASEAALKHWDAAIAADQQAILRMPDLQLAQNNLAWAIAHKRAGIH